MTEYLRAADVKITERVATALFYGIKTDTLHLERSGTRADMEAFAYLYGLANHNILRRIERPELPLDALDALGDALVHRTIIQNVALRPPGPGQPARSHPAVRGPVPPGQGHRVVRRLRPDGRRGAHLGPQRRLRPGGRGRRADRVRRARLGRRPPLGGEGGDPAQRPGPPASGPLEAAAMRRAIVNRFVHALDGSATAVLSQRRATSAARPVICWRPGVAAGPPVASGARVGVRG